ncbi:hypothetical protein METBIDRAFT_41605 [Metschnikowia bicuspidata var. bicuspidata NRRL YB-4993]|uniref:Formamidopyrimidine-DNA glycosylase catalytic domain-containing protein n=1 Tax=Metschnikowia bicuspidata var. bicuspidata NRRL YB-4993 TaxID=869754 RepID=A0A1A0HAD4_9ASCO|nr:hypothetical protein METBIDRAFT_41605 [Metschnikowia bicuspidata var. bicuspidata NRRL YB-4993]OBA20837.1 hypothetical protein METBIDRAFT_41605 [Metschnikowia bicuspidata var. bicuspidata NRRL YB-4993]
MPEVAEVAHACALLRRNVVGLTVRRAVLPLDNLLFPILKTAENPAAVIHQTENHLVGATVQSLGRHGKYFWLRFRTALGAPLVMLMHFGMTGRIRMRDVHSHMIFMENGGDRKVLEAKNSHIAGGDIEQEKDTEKAADSESLPEVWPPRFTKFELFFSGPSSAPGRSIDLAFLDPRRLARVRFLMGEEYSTDNKLLLMPPLRALGPDYSKQGTERSTLDGEPLPDSLADFSGDPDPNHHGRPRLSPEEFAPLVLLKKKPIKAFLLDQEFFAGIGNWVSDEILYHARIHPSEVISRKISSPEHPVLRRLYDAIVFVMEESVRVEGNARLFPEDWLMLHRWGKGRKEPRAVTTAGYTVDFLTVGGRTSCFIPELQKPLKTEDGSEMARDVKPKKDILLDKTPTPSPKSTRRSKAVEIAKIKEEENVGVKRRRRDGH